MSVSAWADERVDITALDGVQLVGELVGSSGPGVVLVPGASRDRRSWEAVARAIADHGFRTLRFDLRGQGDSTRSPDLAETARDVEGAYRYLLARKIRPVFLVGDGIGGTASLLVASRVPVAGVVAFGPPSAHLSSDANAALPKIHAPLLFVTDEEDQVAKTLAVLPTSSHVVTVLDPDVLASPLALESLVRFLGDPKGAFPIDASTPSKRARP